MAISYKARIGFRIKKFKQFMANYARVRRGVLGLGIIIAYVIIAIIAPVITPYDPKKPTLPGHYPGGAPPLADLLTVPIWYRQLPGGDKYSENLLLTSDHTFSTGLGQWNWTIDNPDLITARYNSEEGEQEDGCIEINYQRGTPTPLQNSTSITLTHNFTYPFNGPPRSFWMHVSQKVVGTVSANCKARIELKFKRYQEYANYTDHFQVPTNATVPGIITLTHPISQIIRIRTTESDLIENIDWMWIRDTQNINITTSLPTPTEIWVTYMYNFIEYYRWPTDLFSYEGPIIILNYPLITRTVSEPQTSWTSTWFYSKLKEIYENPIYWYQPEQKIFPKSGNYTFIIKVTFQDTAGAEKNMTLYLDNVNTILYGSAFGFLGTDENPGNPRDIFTSMIYGARLSIFIGFVASVIEVFLGLIFGLISGFFGGIVDEIIMRAVDLLMCLPGLPLILVLMVIVSPSIWTIIVILSFLGWMGMARNIRSMTLSLRERAFVDAAKVSGAGGWRIIFKHILPNVFALVYLALAVSIPGVIVTEASLSWFGLYDPNQVSWGRLLYEFENSGVSYAKGFSEYWFWVIPPGVAISALSIAFILTGYSLDEILNPRLRMRR